jgi:hypothetical protein
MATQDWFILTKAQVTTLGGLPKVPPINAEVTPRAVDAASPGIGINLNPEATDYPVGGEVVTLITVTEPDGDGSYVAPRRVVNDDAHSAETKAFLMTMPIAGLDSDTIFAPPPPLE